ncbi:MAG: DUF2955 domain-containing protein [Pseudomonadales bacterium]
MPTDGAPVTGLPLPARRVFRLAVVAALALAVSYGLGATLPFLAPIFALILTATPAPPLGIKGMVGLCLAVITTFGLGLVLAPLLISYPLSAVLMIAVGIYASNHLAINLGKGLVATLLVMGITLVSAAGTVSTALAVGMIQALVVGIGIAVVCQLVVYPWFPEDPPMADQPESAAPVGPAGAWAVMRATLVVLPVYLLTLTNPTFYLPVIMKSVVLGQQTTGLALKDAGRELLESTLLAGILAIAIWGVLTISVNLWMYTLLMLLVTIACGGRLYGAIRSRFTPSFWQNALVTMLILLGAAVEDSANGKDVYQAFAVRISLFVGVTVYAWLAVVGLDRLRRRMLTGGARRRLESTASRSAARGNA